MSNWNKIVKAAKKTGSAAKLAEKRQMGGLKSMAGAPVGASFKVASKIRNAQKAVSEGVKKKKKK